MEYKLYGYIAGWKLLDVSNREKDLINTMEDYIYGCPTAYFIIIKRDVKQNMDIPYRNIMNRDDFIEYKQEVLNTYQLTKKKKK